MKTNPTNISKREYIATQILCGLLAGCDENYNYGENYESAVKQAVQFTDALIRQLATRDCPNCHYDRNPLTATVCEVCETPLGSAETETTDYPFKDTAHLCGDHEGIDGI